MYGKFNPDFLMDGKIKKIRTEIEKLLGTKMVTGYNKKGDLDSQDAKKIFAKVTKVLTTASLSQIGKPINRNHDAVINLITRADEHIETDKSFRTKYERCLEHISKTVIDERNDVKLKEWEFVLKRLKIKAKRQDFELRKTNLEIGDVESKINELLIKQNSEL